MNLALWVLQGLLAGLFAFAGAFKLFAPIDAVVAQSHMPAAFLRFVGVAELCGAIGLLLPRVLKVKPWLTPLAAAGLTVVMVGAAITTAMSDQPAATALFPAATGLLTAFVGWGRWRGTR